MPVLRVELAALGDPSTVAFERAREWSEEITAVDLHAVGRGAGSGAFVEVGRHDACARAVRRQDLRHRSASGAQIDRRTARW